VQDGRVHIEKINYPMLFQDKARPDEHGAGLKLAIERGWLWMHESGTYVKIAPEGRGAGCFGSTKSPTSRVVQ
jgi:hypothetical protein